MYERGKPGLYFEGKNHVSTDVMTYHTDMRERYRMSWIPEMVIKPYVVRMGP